MSDEQPSHEEVLARLRAMRKPTHEDAAPQRMGEIPGLRDALQGLVDAHLALPLQHCVQCGAAYRYHKPGRCYDCGERAYREARRREQEGP